MITYPMFCVPVHVNREQLLIFDIDKLSSCHMKNSKMALQAIVTKRE